LKVEELKVGSSSCQFQVASFKFLVAIATGTDPFNFNYQLSTFNFQLG
jgi:hypothetical protein